MNNEYEVNRNPKLNVNPTTLYIEADQDPRAYNISKLLNIEAIDWRGVALPQDSILIDTDTLDTTAPGKYIVSVAVMDSDYNATRKDVTVIVVDPEDEANVKPATSSEVPKFRWIKYLLSGTISLSILSFILYSLWDMFR